MTQTHYQRAVKDILNFKEEVIDYWKERGFVPLMSKRRHELYPNGLIPEAHVIGWQIDKSNPLNMLIVAPTGVGKTRLYKNIIKHYWKAGYDILVIDPKSYEMSNAKNKGQGRRLHQFDKNESLPVKCFVPSYVYEEIPDPLKSKFTVYSHPISSFRSRDIWKTLGVADKGADFIARLILGGVKDIEEIEKKIKKEPTIMPQVKNSAINNLSSLKGNNFFNDNYKSLPLEEEWEKGNIVSISYFSQDGSFMCMDIGHIIGEVARIGTKQSQKGLKHVRPKLIVFDDALFYGLRDSAGSGQNNYNYALKQIKNCQNNYRSLGVNSIIVVQNPKLIDANIIDGCPIKIVGAIQNPDSLSGKLDRRAFDVLRRGVEEDGLYQNPKTYTFEWIVEKNMEWNRGYPFDCTVGH